MNDPYVIILANGLNGLGAVRSAAYAGLRTYTLLTSQTDLSAYSRYSQYRFMLPANPGVDDIRPVLDQLYRNEDGPGVLLACSDLAAELLGKLKTEGYANHHLIVPSSETTEILNDKKLECQSMEEGGITLPKTYYELASDVPESYPLIIKLAPSANTRYWVRRMSLLTPRLSSMSFAKSSAASWTVLLPRR